MAKSSYSKIDEYGFERAADFNYESYNNFLSGYVRTLTRRSLRWNTITDGTYRKNNKLKRFIRKGIPGDRRVSVWMAVSGAANVKKECLLSYQEMREKVNNQSINDSIKIDLPRTFPDNIFFTKQDDLQLQLYNILASFAQQNTEVGYCQGLNYIAGLLLLVTKHEEISFWLLKTLVEKILPKYYVPTMKGLLTDLDVLNELVQKLEPTVHQHIHNLGMPWALGTTKWFICLYAEVLPTETVLRIWDCLFNEGSKIIFRVAITLIKLHKNEILQTTELGELIACFRNMHNHENVIDCHQFMNDIFRLSRGVSGKIVENLRKKHHQ